MNQFKPQKSASLIPLPIISSNKHSKSLILEEANKNLPFINNHHIKPSFHSILQKHCDSAGLYVTMTTKPNITGKVML